MATFVVGVGNRGFFPDKYIAEARDELPERLKELGHKTIMKPVEGEDLGAVEAQPQGAEWAKWFKSLDEKVDGIIWTHPNFGDESGMLPALYEAGKSGTKIFIHGYPDKWNQLDWDQRRDSFCGIMSTMDVLTQFAVPFVKLSPHVVSPGTNAFAKNIDLFTRICEGTADDPYRPVAFQECTNGENVLDGTVLFAAGARTSPFQTCRYDELTAAINGIRVETEDLSTIMFKMDKLPVNQVLWDKMQALDGYTCWAKALKNDPHALEKQGRFAVVLDEYIKTLTPDAIGIRCWTEWQIIKDMSVCATISYLNNGGNGKVIPTACEVDLGNALTMYVMNKYGGSELVACQDWNNNFKGDPNKLAFMHCGPHAKRWLDPKAKLRDGHIGDYVETQAIVDVTAGGTSYGCIQGRFLPGEVTLGSATIGPDGITFYFTEGEITSDVIPPEYFGSAGVVKVPGLQNALIQIGQQGFKHHFSMGSGHVADKCIEVLRQHSGYKVMDLRKA